MHRLSIDLNCDLAEGTGNEEKLMPWISSANIACGYHAGDEELMKHTIALCLKHRVAVGAHPSFPDRENFGRTNLNLPHDQVFNLIIDQLNLIEKIARQQGAILRHVKPHGALYNMAAKDAELASVVAQAVKKFDARLIFYGLSGSVMIEEAQKLNLITAHEVFADRTYQPDGSLTPRSQPHALIENEQQSLAQAMLMAKENKVTDVNGHIISVQADTICLHGDGAHAVVFAKRINLELKKGGIEIKRIHSLIT